MRWDAKLCHRRQLLAVDANLCDMEQILPKTVDVCRERRLCAIGVDMWHERCPWMPIGQVRNIGVDRAYLYGGSVLVKET